MVQFLVKKRWKKRNFVITIPTLCLFSSSQKKVKSRSVDCSTCFQLSEIFNCFPDSSFDHVWIIFETIFCSEDLSRIQEKVENLKNWKLQIQGQSSKTQVEKVFKNLQNLEKWMIFDKTDRYYPIVLGFFTLFWVNFELASVIFSIFRKKPDARTKFEKSRLFTKKFEKSRRHHEKKFFKNSYLGYK